MPVDPASKPDLSMLCPYCGAEHLESARTCWLCKKSLTGELASAGGGARNPPAEASSPKVPRERFSFSLSTLLLLMTLAAVCLGLLAEAPGLGVPMCVLLLPVLIRTAMVVRRREAAGLPVSRTEKISLMATSFGVATVVAVVVAVAAFCSFCGVCLLAVSIDYSYGGPGTALWGVVVCAVAGLSIWLLVVLSKWMRRRYRRDVGEERR